MRGRVKIKYEKHHCERDQDESSHVDWQDRRQIKRQNQRNRPDHAGKNCSGRTQFADNPVDRDQHQDEHDFRSPQFLKYALGRRHLDFGQLRAGGVERFAVHNAPVQFLQQIGHIGRDQINDFQFQGFLRSDRSALLYGGLGPFNVALALARNGLHVADGKVFELLLHGFVWLFFATARKTADGNRMRRADRSGRRHCRDIGRKRDEAACAGRGRAGGRDVNHNGN